MSQTKVRFTHKGWFGVCPVHIADPDSKEPTVAPRHWTLTPLMWLSEGLFSLVFGVLEMMGQSHSGWPIAVGGELAVPYEETVEDLT